MILLDPSWGVIKLYCLFLSISRDSQLIRVVLFTVRIVRVKCTFNADSIKGARVVLSLRPHQVLIARYSLISLFIS